MIYLLLAEREALTASFGPSFFSSLILWPKREARWPVKTRNSGSLRRGSHCEKFN